MSTNVSSTAGSSAVLPAVIKRRSVSQEAPKAFIVDEGPGKKQETSSSSEPGEAQKVFSEAEKKYFANLFPTEADAIQSYSPYQKNGMKRPASIGTLVDVKG